MTDSPQWQPPSDFARDATPGPAPFSTPAGTPPPAGSMPAGSMPPGSIPPPSVTPGWTPPPKPGLIPLRPLTLGAILGASFQVLRRNPRPMFGFSLLMTGVVFVVTLVLSGVITFLVIGRLSNMATGQEDVITAGTIGAAALAIPVVASLSVIATAILQGIVALEVARGTLGEKLKLGGLWRAARGRIGALIGWTLLLTLAVLVALTLVTVAIIALVTLGGNAGIAIGVLLGVLAGLAALVLALWLSTRLAFVPSVLLLERLPLRVAIGRSWALTMGHFWRILGIQLLVAVIIQVVSSIITTPLSLVFGLATSLLNPNGDIGAQTTGTIILLLVTSVISLVYGAITAVVQSATTALLYIDTRMRKEGLDLELSHFVEARQAGDSSVPDPYLLRATA